MYEVDDEFDTHIKRYTGPKQEKKTTSRNSSNRYSIRKDHFYLFFSLSLSLGAQSCAIFSFAAAAVCDGTLDLVNARWLKMLIVPKKPPKKITTKQLLEVVYTI